MPANIPTTKFRNIPLATATTAVDTKSERAGVVSGESVVSTGGGNEWDFASVNISGGAANSAVRTIFWDVTYANGNDTVDNFKFWLPTATNGFEMASDMLFTTLSFDDVGTTTNVSDVYAANATVGSYNGWAVIPASEPSQNVYSAVDTTSIAITGVTTSGEASEVVAIAAYFAIADEETTGTYRGTTSGYELQCAFKFDFS